MPTSRTSPLSTTLASPTIGRVALLRACLLLRLLAASPARGRPDRGSPPRPVVCNGLLVASAVVRLSWLPVAAIGGTEGSHGPLGGLPPLPRPGLHGKTGRTQGGEAKDPGEAGGGKEARIVLPRRQTGQERLEEGAGLTGGKGVLEPDRSSWATLVTSPCPGGRLGPTGTGGESFGGPSRGPGHHTYQGGRPSPLSAHALRACGGGP